MTSEEISKQIFYKPATNGKAENSIKEGAALIDNHVSEQLKLHIVKNWVAVDDAKPEENQVVWVMTEQNQGPSLMEYAYVNDGDNSGWIWANVYDAPMYHNGKWQAEGEWDDDYNVTHWMALPEPPCS